MKKKRIPVAATTWINTNASIIFSLYLLYFFPSDFQDKHIKYLQIYVNGHTVYEDVICDNNMKVVENCTA